ncbi:MAG: hypothetical protein H6924_06450 [Alphaproteobacteria bacterium]|nr:hypothetical protein [Alphaproteobacteria bacterium]
MMRLNLSSLAILVFALAVTPALAQQTDAAPPSLAAWPAPTCEKPDSKPLEMKPGNDSGDIAAYNTKVHRFNRMSAEFNACTKAYIDTIHQQIETLRTGTKAKLKAIVDHGNGRIRTVARQVNMAVEAGNQAAAGQKVSVPAIADPDPEFPPAACKPPDEALLKRTSKLNRVSAKAANAYDAQYDAFNACIADYIDKGQAELRKIQADTAARQQAMVDRTNKQIDLLNQLSAQAADGATETARQTAAKLGMVSTEDPATQAVDRDATLPP